MAVGKLGKFQTKGFTSWYPKVEKKNHISSIFGSQPQKVANCMIQLLAHERGKSLETFLSQFPTKEFESDDEFTWDVIGSSYRNIPLVEARDENGVVITADSANVGVGGAPFYLVFAEEYFADGKQ